MLAITRTTLLSPSGPLDTTAPAAPTVAGPVYQQILVVFHAGAAPLRAKDICPALVASATAMDTENLRAKLKRLA
ncbi:hypothetical protein [Micromonospora violae]|uniref:hypothetical protein n=1 Tax=Micromonospora violae TaxID=1278207 RepID=UPI0033D1E9FA